MTTQIECPICMDCIEMTKNCMTTECGHCFHTSCLMKNVAHNGFECPYCRTAMAEVVKDDASEAEEFGLDEEMFDDDALRGFRLFWNTVDGVEQDPEDIEEEEEAEEEEEEEDVYLVPPVEYVAKNLEEQGITFEDLVGILLERDHEEYEEDNYGEIDGQVFGKIRIMVSNWEPRMRDQTQEESAPTTPAPTQAPAPVADLESQPKNVTVRRNYNSGFLSHV